MGKPLPDIPRKADIVKEIFRPLPIISLASGETGTNADIASRIIQRLVAALERRDEAALQKEFFSQQAYWKDSLALTYHFRTFVDGGIAPALLELHGHRRITDAVLVPGSEAKITLSSSLTWIEFRFEFKTETPNAHCNARVLALPQFGADNEVDWRIWALSTWLTGYHDFPEDERRLKEPSAFPKRHVRQPMITTQVLIVGAGNSGLVLASRLKALGVDYVLIDKRKHVGDNWAQRYDNLRFHVPNGFCHPPYLPYPDLPPGLHRDDLAEHLRRFAMTFNLDNDIMSETTIESTSFDADAKTWKARLRPSGRTVTCQHLVLATGVCASAPHVPELQDEKEYRGLSIHSADFKNGKLLAGNGVKSVTVVGSANTAFDVLEDCHNAGLKTTMVQRSPTYVFPFSYSLNPSGFGNYDHAGPEIMDPIFFGSPLAVSGQLIGTTQASWASEEPDRYAKLAAAGFLVKNCTEGNIVVSLADRWGGHFIEIGTGVQLIESGKVGVRSGVTPVSYTAGGLKLSDGTTVESDAVIFCTGFKDSDVRTVVVDILGEGGEGGEYVRDMMEPTFGVDEEGETRGMWKRNAGLENFFVIGGGAGYQRWFSKLIALQIKGSLEGILPEAYRSSSR